MTAKPFFAFLLGVIALVAFAAALHMRTRSGVEALEQSTNVSANPVPPESVPAPTGAEPARATTNVAPQEYPSVAVTALAPGPTRLQRLEQVRETFRALATGNPAAALRAAKELSDENERETALLTLVTQWTGGELRPARERAQLVAALGLETGLGMELVKNPELALLWATELTDDIGRSALLYRLASTMAASDPLQALAFAGQVPEKDRSTFSDAVYGQWASDDTTAALQSVDQIPDPAEREAALQAVRRVAPVGIGAEMRMQDGLPVINRLLPGTPAELSGQLPPGDRIVALAQADNSFVEARTLSLAEVVQMIRGAPGTSLQLQVVPADATPDSPPRTVSIMRDQIKLKK